MTKTELTELLEELEGELEEFEADPDDYIESYRDGYHYKGDNDPDDLPPRYRNEYEAEEAAEQFDRDFAEYLADMDKSEDPKYIALVDRIKSIKETLAGMEGNVCS